MIYKKILRSRAFRLKVLEFLSFVPDKQMIQIQYRIKTGRRLNLRNPVRYTEKLQWYKLYYRDPLMVACTDKFEVRKYVEQCGLGDILTKCYGVFDEPNEIDFNSLPMQFVLKDTLGGGGNSVIIVRDKSSLDVDYTLKMLEEWVRKDPSKPSGGREWVYYSGQKHRIIVEELIDSDPRQGGLVDFKFLCFSGKIALLYVMSDRILGQGASCGFFTEEFERLPYTESDEWPLEREISKPSNFDQMKRVAEILSAPFPCARVDLYNVEGKIRFGEITFFDSSGYMTFEPDDLDFVLGEKFFIETNRNPKPRP